MSESLIVGDLHFLLRRSPRRKTIGIIVERDGTLAVAAPLDCPLAEIQKVAVSKQFWTYTKLAEKGLLQHLLSSREYVSGEGFYYLGRSYRLLLIDPSADEAILPALRLQHGRFLLRRDERARAQIHFVAWYTAHAQPWLEPRVTLLADRIGVEPIRISVRDLGHRWASCSQRQSLNFHWRAILLPARIIDYLVAHELVHLHEQHHGAEFWRRLERAMPDYAARKQWLAEHGGGFE